MSRSIFKNLTITATLLLASTSVFSNSENTSLASGKLQSGTVVGKHIFGLARDFQDDPLMIREDPLIYQNASNTLDVQVDESRFKVSLFDHLNAGVYLTDLDAESDKALDTRSLSLGKIGGAHGVGAVLKTSWNSVLFSENGLVNGNKSDQLVEDLKYYFKGKEDLVKPYNYGWLNEVIVLDAQGNAKVIKNYSAGRTFASNIIAMPDSKTFYLFDAKHSGNVFVFIADEPNSFAKGSLYVISEADEVTAIELGKSSALKMKFKLRKAGFGAFFKSSSPEQGKCASGYKFIDTVFGPECLKVQKKNRKYVGQFEPIRMAAMKGVEPLGRGFTDFHFDSHNNVIKIKHNDGQSRQYKLIENTELGTQYFMTN